MRREAPEYSRSEALTRTAALWRVVSRCQRTCWAPGWCCVEEKNTWRPLSLPVPSDQFYHYFGIGEHFQRDLRLSNSEKSWDGNGHGWHSTETSGGQEHPGRWKLETAEKSWDQRRLIYESVAVALASLLATLCCIRVIKLCMFNMLLCSVDG